MSRDADNNTGKNRLLLKSIIGVVGLVALMVWAGGYLSAKVAPGQVAAQVGLPLPEKADTAEVVSRPVAPRLDIVGTAVSVENVHLSARLSAYIRQVHVTAGDQVTKGQVLVSLDDRELKEKLAAAEAQLRQATIEYDRARTLKSAKATTDQALVAARAAFQAAQAQVQGIKVMLSFTEIVSPLDGKVTDRRIEAGDLANPGQVLLTVYDPLHMRVEAPVPLRLADKLKVGQEVEVSLDRPDKTLTGKVSEVVAEVDPASRTQVVKVLLPEAGGDVLPGTFARLWVADDPRPSLLVPASAVYRVGQLEMVQVVEGQRAVRRLVKTGASQDGMLEVLSGLSAGEKVLRTPLL